MPNRPNFPIPDDIHAAMQCIQLCIPNEPTYKSVFAGLIYELTYWYNWQRTDDDSGAQCAAVWKEIYNSIDWSTMSCCCEDQIPARFRYSDAGVYQRSTDGGITWIDAHNYDYRNTSTIWPPPELTGIDVTKCAAADAVVAVFRDKIVQQVNEDMGAAAILGVIAAALLIFLSEGTATGIAAQVTALVAAILGAGIAAWQAAFTSTVWDDFRCIVYCAMSTGDSIDADGLQEVLNGINTKFIGIVQPTLYGYVNAAGVVGLTNMMRSNEGDPDANCDDCDCGYCPIEWNFYGCDVIAHENSTYVVRGNGVGHIAWSSGDMSQGCYLYLPHDGAWNIWPVGSPTPVLGYPTSTNLTWNGDTGIVSTTLELTFVFATTPFL
jgi:hypothetical protein